MYIVKVGDDGREMPTEEYYYGDDARDIILTSFLKSGYEREVSTVCDITEEEMQLNTEQYFSTKEIEALKSISDYTSVEEWELLTVEAIEEKLTLA